MKRLFLKTLVAALAVVAGAVTAASGSTLLRSPGRSKPVQYAFSGDRRSACPITSAKAST